MRSKKLFVEENIPLPRHLVWELLSNTDHLNRFLGLFPVEFEQPESGESKFFREAAAKMGGFVPITWREFPFEWVKNERYSVVRTYHSGPFRYFRGGIELADAQECLPDGTPATVLRVFAEIVAANFLGLLTIPFVAKSSMRKTVAYCREYLELNDQRNIHLLPKTKVKYNVNRPELGRLCKELAQTYGNTRHISLLQEHLQETGDNEVIDIRPYELAKRWKEDPEDILRMFLYATKSGIVNLSWNLICPNCRVSKSSFQTLSQFQKQFHCDLCGIEYSADFDKQVELRFSVHPFIRKAYAETYCIGGPVITPHIIVQTYIEKGKTAIITYPDTVEQLRFRVLRKNHMLPLARSSEKSADPNGDIHVQYETKGWDTQFIPEPAPGSRIGITNRSFQDIVVALEELQTRKDTVSAAKVTTLPEFRHLFSSEVLAPGQQVGIESVSLFFSDLRGSTSLYERIGDAHAYGKVRKHFEFLSYWITRNSGSLVKTIGDAVMAVFYEPQQAIKAALNIQLHVDEFNATLRTDEKIVIKIGIHHGPAIAVNSNDKLDYFGRTVNIAARIQGTSIGGDIVVSEECLHRQGVQHVLQEYQVKTAAFEVHLQGIDGTQKLIRILPNKNSF